MSVFILFLPLLAHRNPQRPYYFHYSLRSFHQRVTLHCTTLVAPHHPSSYLLTPPTKTSPTKLLWPIDLNHVMERIELTDRVRDVPNDLPAVLRPSSTQQDRLHPRLGFVLRLAGGVEKAVRGIALFQQHIALVIPILLVIALMENYLNCHNSDGGVRTELSL